MLYTWCKLAGMVVAGSLAAVIVFAGEGPVDVPQKVVPVAEQAPGQQQALPQPDGCAEGSVFKPRVEPQPQAAPEAGCEPSCRGPQFPFIPPGWEQRQLHFTMPMVVPSHFPKDWMTSPAVPFPPCFGWPEQAIGLFAMPPLAKQVDLEPFPMPNSGSLQIKEEVRPDGFGGLNRLRVRTWTHNGVPYRDVLEQTLPENTGDEPKPAADTPAVPSADTNLKPSEQNVPEVPEASSQSADTVEPPPAAAEVAPPEVPTPVEDESPDLEDKPKADEPQADAPGTDHGRMWNSPEPIQNVPRQPLSPEFRNPRETALWPVQIPVTSQPASAKQMTNIWHATHAVGPRTKVYRYDRRGPNGEGQAIGVQVTTKGTNGAVGVSIDASRGMTIYGRQELPDRTDHR